MPSDKFSKSNDPEPEDLKDPLNKKLVPVIDAVLSGRVKNLESEGEDYVENPFIQNPQTKLNNQVNLSESEIAFTLERASIETIVFKIIKSKHPNWGIYFEKRPNGNFLLHANSKEHTKRIEKIFTHPIMQVLQMESPEIAQTLGKELENNGRLSPIGITNRIYARYLLTEIAKYRKSKRKDAVRLINEFTEELTVVVGDGFEPLSDKEATLLIEQVVEEILQNKG